MAKRFPYPVLVLDEVLEALMKHRSTLGAALRHAAGKLTECVTEPHLHMIEVMALSTYEWNDAIV